MHFARVFYSNAEDDSNASMESRAVTPKKKRGKEAKVRNKEWNPKLITREKIQKKQTK